MLRGVLVAIMWMAVVGCSDQPIPMSPGPYGPCGAVGISCPTQHSCCPEGHTCGGEPNSVGCPAGACCFVEPNPNDLARKRVNRPQTMMKPGP
jgi:hypothetical protein